MTADRFWFVAGSWSGSVAERHFGRTDPGQVVADEVMGMLITLFLNPVGWAGALVGFLLFRVADIVKPFPANRLERLPGGVGVMADDGMAAVYANLVLRLIIWLTGAVLISGPFPSLTKQAETSTAVGKVSTDARTAPTTDDGAIAMLSAFFVPSRWTSSGPRTT